MDQYQEITQRSQIFTFQDCIQENKLSLTFHAEPSENSKKLWRKAFQKLRFVSRLARMVQSSQSNPYAKTAELLDFHIENHSKPEKFSKIPFFIIVPQSFFTSFWLFVISASIIYIAVIDLFLSAFHKGFKGEIEVGGLLDCILIIDFVLNLNLAYYEENGSLVADRKKIFFKYLSGWMVCNAISSIPFSLIGIIRHSPMKVNNVYPLFRYKNIFKLFRLPWLFQTLINSSITEHLDYKIFSYPKLTRFMKLLLILFMCIHVVSCLFFLSGEMNIPNPKTFKSKYHLPDLAIPEQYLLCVYWTITTLTTVGYGDITPHTQFEQIFAILWMIVGVYVISYSVGFFTTFYADLSFQDKIAHKKIKIAENFAIKNLVPLNIMKLVKRSIKNTNYSYGKQDIEHLFRDVPMNLKHEIVKNFYGGSISKFPFFALKDQIFVTDICLRLEKVSYQKNEILWLENENASGIFFVIEGKVGFSHKRMVFAFFNQGNYFGDFEVIGRVQRKFKAKCFEQSTLLVMSNEVVKMIEEKYSRVWKTMKKDWKKRRDNIINELAEMTVLKKANLFGSIDQFAAANYKEHVVKEAKEKHEECSAFTETEQLKRLSKLLDETAQKMNRSMDYVEILSNLVQNNLNTSHTII